MKKLIANLVIANLLAFNILHSDLKQSIQLKNECKDLITIGILSHPSNINKNIHYQLITPDKEGPYPLVIFFHGAKAGAGILGKKDAKNCFRAFLNEGFAVLVPSFPGFGLSDGPCDYCGEYTKEALHAVIDDVLAREEISNTFGIVGFGMGAIAALTIGADRDDLQWIVASNGMYDFKEAFQQSFELKWSFTKADYFPLTKEEISKRSMLLHLSKINAPTLFMHAKDDPYVPCMQSIRAYRRMQSFHKQSSLKLFESSTHMIPWHQSIKAALEFIKAEVDKQS